MGSAQWLADAGPPDEEVWITRYALDKSIGVYKVTGHVMVDVVPPTRDAPPGRFFANNCTMFMHDEWHRTEKLALIKVRAMARKTMKRLMNEHNHVKNVALDAREGILPVSRK